MASKFTPVLRQVGIFASLGDDVLDELCGTVGVRHCPKGDSLFRQGDPGDELFIVASGRIKVFVGDGSEEHVLAFLGEGESLGEMALLTGDPRSASATALVDTRLLVIPKDAFDCFVASNLPAMLEIARVLARRQAQTNTQFVARDDGAAPDRAAVLQVLTIQIDHRDVQEQVEEICALDFFEELESKAARRRRAHDAAR